MAEYEPIIPPYIEERESDIAFTDTSGEISLNGKPLDARFRDFDDVLSRAVRKGGQWPHEVEFGTGDWPEVAGYGLALTEQLRAEQVERLERLVAYREKRGIENPLRSEQTLEHSLGSLVVVQANSNPRGRKQHLAGVNGSDWYVGTAGDNLAFVSQLQYLEDVERFGKLTYLGRVPREVTHELWHPGEQFTSSISPLLAELHKEDLDTVFDYPDLNTREEAAQAGEHPELFTNDVAPARIAYIDRFLNVRLLVASQREIVDQIEAGANFRLFVNGSVLDEPIDGGHSLGSSAPDRLTIYKNPADPLTADGFGFIELARPVDNPNDVRTSAFATIVQHIENTSGSFDPRSIANIDLEIKPV